MFKIGRAINGISINGDEYILDGEGKIMLFKTEKDALSFLNAHGYNFKSVTDAWDNCVNIKECV